MYLLSEMKIKAKLEKGGVVTVVIPLYQFSSDINSDNEGHHSKFPTLC